MIKKKTILITGAKGTVGSYFPIIFNDKKYRLLMYGKEQLDVTDKRHIDKVMLKERPDYVVHLAAITNVDACQKDPERTYNVNTKGTEDIAHACEKYKSILFFVSTSAVFKGEKKGYREGDKPSPVNVYGKSKSLAEKRIREITKKHYIIRAGWMIGGGVHEKKFISYIVSQLNSQTTIKAVDDKFGTITYARDLVDLIRKMIDKNIPYGIYHFGSKGICSRFDIAKVVASTLHKHVEIIAVSSDLFMKSFFAPRPTYETLKSNKILFKKTWRQSIREYIKNEII